MGLAVPTAVMVATGRGAEMGLLIKGGEILQRAGDVDTVVLDKTGTVTEGRPAMLRVIAVDSLSELDVLRYASALERHSEHPVGAAVVRATNERALAPIEATDFKSFTGAGVTGRVEQRDVAVGNAQLMRDLGIDVESVGAAGVQRGTGPDVAEGVSLLYVAVDRRIAGVLIVADSVRPSSADAVRQLKSMGVDVLLVTGDRRSTADTVARALEIDRVEAEVGPQEKIEVIRDLQRQRRVVAMVGDGINDAPALAQADVGISMPKGTDIAIEASDIALMRSDLRGVPTAISLSRQTMATMKQNLFWAFIYNVIGIPIAAGILYPITGLMLSPVIASAAMALSSVSVVTNSLRLRRARLA
jgi:Cu+-exporting ATPase